jgi:hypothetical protein
LLGFIFRASWIEGWYDRDDYMESALLKKQLVITRSQFSLRNSSSFRSKLYHTWSDKVCELDIRGIVHYEFVPIGQTVNQVYYLEVLKRLRKKVRRKRLELFANNSWILHHDNVPAHTTRSVREFLVTKQITVLEHPANSPDLAHSDFFSVPEDKGNIERKAF